LLLRDHEDVQTGAGAVDAEITQIGRWRRSGRARKEEWLVGKTGATLGHIRSLWL